VGESGERNESFGKLKMRKMTLTKSPVPIGKLQKPSWPGAAGWVGNAE